MVKCFALTACVQSRSLAWYFFLVSTAIYKDIVQTRRHIILYNPYHWPYEMCQFSWLITKGQTLNSRITLLFNQDVTFFRPTMLLLLWLNVKCLRPSDLMLKGTSCLWGAWLQQDTEHLAACSRWSPEARHWIVSVYWMWSTSQKTVLKLHTHVQTK